MPSHSPSGPTYKFYSRVQRSDRDQLVTSVQLDKTSGHRQYRLVEFGANQWDNVVLSGMRVITDLASTLFPRGAQG